MYDIPKSLLNFDISFGYSYWNKLKDTVEEDVEDKNYLIKLLSKFSTLKSIFTDPQYKEKELNNMKILLDNVTYLSNNSGESLNGISMQINGKVRYSQFLKSLFNNINMFNSKLLTDMLLSDNGACLYKERIIIGLNHFDKKIYDNLRKDLKKEDLFGFVLFHEYGHHLDNKKRLERIELGKDKNDFNNFYDLIVKLNEDFFFLMNLNSDYKIHHKASKIDYFNSELNSLIIQTRKEMFSDVYAVLMTRNKYIEEDRLGDIDKFLDAIIKFRLDEVNRAVNDRILENDCEGMWNNLGFSTCHNTVDALLSLKKIIKELDGKLSEKEIVDFTDVLTNQGMAVFLHKNKKINAEFDLQINVLTNLIKDDNKSKTNNFGIAAYNDCFDKLVSDDIKEMINNGLLDLSILKEEESFKMIEKQKYLFFMNNNAFIEYKNDKQVTLKNKDFSNKLKNFMDEDNTNSSKLNNNGEDIIRPQSLK